MGVDLKKLKRAVRKLGKREAKPQRRLLWKVIAVALVVGVAVAGVWAFWPRQGGPLIEFGPVRYVHSYGFVYVESEDNLPLENVLLYMPFPNVNDNLPGTIENINARFVQTSPHRTSPAVLEAQPERVYIDAAPWNLAAGSNLPSKWTYKLRIYVDKLYHREIIWVDTWILGDNYWWIDGENADCPIPSMYDDNVRWDYKSVNPKKNIVYAASLMLQMAAGSFFSRVLESQNIDNARITGAGAYDRWIPWPVLFR